MPPISDPDNNNVTMVLPTPSTTEQLNGSQAKPLCADAPEFIPNPCWAPPIGTGFNVPCTWVVPAVHPGFPYPAPMYMVVDSGSPSFRQPHWNQSRKQANSADIGGSQCQRRKPSAPNTPERQTPHTASAHVKASETLVASSSVTEATPEKGRRCWADVARSVPALPANPERNAPANDRSNVPPALLELGSQIQNLGISEDGCLDGIEAQIQQIVSLIFDAAALSPAASAGHCAMLFRGCMAKQLCTKECFRRFAVDQVQDRFQQYLGALAESDSAAKELQGFAQFIGSLLVGKILPSKVSALCVQALLDAEDQPGALEALRVLIEELGQLSAKVVNDLLECGSLSSRARGQLLTAAGRKEEAEESKEEQSEQSAKPKTWAEIATASVQKRNAETEVIRQKREKAKALGPLPTVSIPKDVAWGPTRCATPSTAAPSPEAVVLSPAGSATDENSSSPTPRSDSPPPAVANQVKVAKPEEVAGPVEIAKVVEDVQITKTEEVVKKKVAKPMEVGKPEESIKKKTPEVDINALFQEDSNVPVRHPVPSVAVPKEVKWGPKAKPAGPTPATLRRIDTLTKKNNSCQGYLIDTFGMWKEISTASKDTRIKQATAEKETVVMSAPCFTDFQNAKVSDDEAQTVTSGDSCCGSSNSEEVLSEPAAELRVENVKETPKGIQSQSVKGEEAPEIKLDWEVDASKGPVPTVVKPKDVKWGPAMKKAAMTPAASAAPLPQLVGQQVNAQKVAPKPSAGAEPEKMKSAESSAVEVKVHVEEEKCMDKADQQSTAKDAIPVKDFTVPRPAKIKGPVPKEVEPIEVKWGPAKKVVTQNVEVLVDKVPVDLPCDNKEIKEDTKEIQEEAKEEIKEIQEQTTTEKSGSAGETADDWEIAKPTKVRHGGTKTQEKPLEVSAPRFAALQDASVEDSESEEDTEESQEESVAKETTNVKDDEVQENSEEETSTEALSNVRRIDQEKLVAKVFGSWKSEIPCHVKPPVAWGPGAVRTLASKDQPAPKTPAPWSKPIGMKESVAQEKRAASRVEIVDAWDTEVEPEAETSPAQKETEIPSVTGNAYSVHFMLKYRLTVGSQKLENFLHYTTQEVTEEQPDVVKSKTDPLHNKTKEELKAERRREWEAKQRAAEETKADGQQPKLEVSTTEPLDDWMIKRTEKVELKPSPNSWAARRHMLRQNTDSTCTAIKGILNKLTLEKFDTLYVQLMECGISKPEHIECLVKEVFERATTQHHFIEMYTMLCTKFSVWCVESGVCEKDSSFKKILLNQCQDSFEKYLQTPEIDGDLPFDERMEALMKYKTKMLGNVKFVGKLLIHKMLSSKIVISCSEELMKLNTDETLETLCAFLKTVGPSFDLKDWKLHGHFMHLFTQLKGLAKDRTAVSSRIRCLIQDVVDLQAIGWDCKREVEGPKLMAEVKADWQRDNGEDVPSKSSAGDWETTAKKGSRRS